MYAKLFSRITESSLMEEPVNVRYTFVMLLAIADPEGYVIGTDIAIARRLNLPIPEFQECLRELMEPDPNSNSKEDDGRRVIPSDHERGYRLVNYITYRDMKDEDERRAYMRDYMRKYRGGKPDVNTVNSGKIKLAGLTQAEVKAEAKEKAVVASVDSLVEGFKKSPAYQGVDIDREVQKMKEWLATPKGKGRRLTHGFMVNWLNKADATLPAKSAAPIQTTTWTPDAFKTPAQQLAERKAREEALNGHHG